MSIPGWDNSVYTVSFTHLRAQETEKNLVCTLVLEKKKFTKFVASLSKFIKDSIIILADYEHIY